MTESVNRNPDMSQRDFFLQCVENIFPLHRKNYSCAEGKKLETIVFPV